tara:strand:- start:139 stop:1071 length:933 start_codon:yes stop_codon:yes gene_type:complete
MDFTIENGDSLKKIDTLEDNSLDLVLTDPPYFLDKLDGSWNVVKVDSDESNSHIKHLPKGMKFDKKQVKALYEFYYEISKKLMKKLKPGGYFLSFSAPRLYHAIAMACEMAGFEIRDQINWVYTQSMPKGQGISHYIDRMDVSAEEKTRLKEEYKDHKTPQLKSCFEPICVAMKPCSGTFLNNELKWGTGLVNFGEKVGDNATKVPANIITCENYDEIYDKNFLIKKPTKAEKGANNSHITVKPVELLEHLIKLFSKERSLVLDPFLGSGSTGVACKNTGRRCIGYEINEKYYKIAKMRCGLEKNTSETK